MDKLSLRRRTRRSVPGGTEQGFLDFEVSGKSLFDELGRRGSQYIGRLGWGPSAYDLDTIKRLALEKSPDLGTDRCILYVCPECGGFDCGAISVRIRQEGSSIVWSQFEWFERNGDRAIEGLGPFIFDRHQYTGTLNSILD